MKKTYYTSQVAKQFHIHPNTVRLYESLGFITSPVRAENGYRQFSELHLDQLRLVRTALEIEVLQNGLRKQAIAIIRVAALQDYEKAIYLTETYLQNIHIEQTHAERSIAYVEQLLSGAETDMPNQFFTRKQAAEQLHISIDKLRNWEMNGLLTVKRRRNGYRVYAEAELKRLMVIHSLRCANYSLTSILRLLNELPAHSPGDIKTIIDTPHEDEDIISICDRLLTSLSHAAENASSMLRQLQIMQKKYGS